MFSCAFVCRHVIHVKNGNTDYTALRQAIADAKKVTDKPTLLKVRHHLHMGFCQSVATVS